MEVPVVKRKNMRLKGQSGTSMVELAIVLPLLLLVLFGTIEFSIALYDKAVLTNASREGARAGIVAQNPRVDDTTIRNVVTNYCSNYLITFGGGTLGITISPSSPRDGLPFGTDLTVTATYRYDFLIVPNFLGNSFGFLNLNATTVMKLE